MEHFAEGYGLGKGLYKDYVARIQGLHRGQKELLMLQDGWQHHGVLAQAPIAGPGGGTRNKCARRAPNRIGHR